MSKKGKAKLRCEFERCNAPRFCEINTRIVRSRDKLGIRSLLVVSCWTKFKKKLTVSFLINCQVLLLNADYKIISNVKTNGGENILKTNSLNCINRSSLQFTQVLRMTLPNGSGVTKVICLSKRNRILKN